MLGNDVLFSTGTDEHGLKVQKAAEIAKKSPLDYCSAMSQQFQVVEECKSIKRGYFEHFFLIISEKILKSLCLNFMLIVKPWTAGYEIVEMSVTLSNYWNIEISFTRLS